MFVGAELVCPPATRNLRCPASTLSPASLVSFYTAAFSSSPSSDQSYLKHSSTSIYGSLANRRKHGQLLLTCPEIGVVSGSLRDRALVISTLEGAAATFPLARLLLDRLHFPRRTKQLSGRRGGFDVIGVDLDLVADLLLVMASFEL